MELSQAVLQSDIWLRTLASRGDANDAQRERMRVSFLSFRERSAQLAIEIQRDVPDLTIHDITHLDALWETASQIVGRQFQLTPTEGYVLGGAILLHDLATSVAATPGGWEGILADVRYRDLVHAEYRRRHGRAPTSMELASPDSEIRRAVLFSLLRTLHAENAEKLAFITFQARGGPQLFLIEEAELRQTFGRLIGEIAHSHWWSLSELEGKFGRVIGAPPWAPADWTIDPLKVACVLRAADAAHIDARRAPMFVRAFSQVQESSVDHWVFQEKLNKPYLRDDALVFTSGYSFPFSEANAWWTCLDALKMIDRELRSTDALLADRDMSRFAARRVAGVDSPERLGQYIQTLDWFPINATVHVSDLPRIIRSIGGEELYGRNPRVPLRELIQNAGDAVRARRLLENRRGDFGEVQVTHREEGGRHYLEVKDNGVGMSRRVLTEFLLDFGKSLWRSQRIQDEFPGLSSSGFESTGRYGIGFFSVFMIADSVKVVTRRCDAAKRDTLVLEFGAGLRGRPILRPATLSEQLIDGGTLVSIHLLADPTAEDGLLYCETRKRSLAIAEVCAQIAPAFDVNLVAADSQSTEVAVRAGDWIDMDGLQLLRRFAFYRWHSKESQENLLEFLDRAAKNLRLVKDEAGEVVGRACITHGFTSSIAEPDPPGMLVVGGLECSPLSGVLGILLGESQRASRDVAKPIVGKSCFARWAEEQTSLVPNLFPYPEAQVACAQIVRLCGGHTGKLPVARWNGRWLSAADLEALKLPDEILLLSAFTVRYEMKHLDDLVLNENVIMTESSGIPVIFQTRGMYATTEFSGMDDEEGSEPRVASLAGAVVEAAAVAWGVSSSTVYRENDFQRETDVTVGRAGGKDITSSVIRLCRPGHGQSK